MSRLNQWIKWLFKHQYLLFFGLKLNYLDRGSETQPQVVKHLNKGYSIGSVS